MQFLEIIDHIFRGIVSGFFIAYLIILGLRPAVMYPDNILDIMDNPWVFLVLFVLNYYIFLWDNTVGILMFLTLIALLFDIVLFTEGGFFNDNMEVFSNLEEISQVQFVAEKQQKKPDYKDINDMILKKLEEMKQLKNQQPEGVSPFL
jgi:Ca2+/Na+ antiporter